MTGVSFASDSPGLVAAAHYLRPSRRAQAISAMVELGMFVREFQCDSADAVGQVEGAELTVVFAGAEPAHIRAVARLASGDRVVAVVLAAGVAAEPFTRVGALRVVTEGDPSDEIRDALSYCGHIARQRRRSHGAHRRGNTVFGSLEFHPTQRWLSRGEHLASLSPPEHGVLRALFTAGGTVVSKDRLQRELSGTDEPASDGYLKTVVLRIRRKAELLGGDPGHLTAVRGAGYVLRSRSASIER
jgi:DNA-binding winged helix-turn-helix (wHTH) protein